MEAKVLSSFLQKAVVKLKINKTNSALPWYVKLIS